MEAGLTSMIWEDTDGGHWVVATPLATPAPPQGGLPAAHRLLQQLLQAVDVGPVPALAFHHHAVSVRPGSCA